MKKALSLIVALALLLAFPLPSMAEAAALPDCFVPTTMMMRFNTQMPDMFRTMGDPDPAGSMTAYMLGNPEMLGDGMRFSNDDGKVTLEARTASGSFMPTERADILTLTIAGSVDPIDATVLKMDFLKVVAGSDPGADLTRLMAWLPDASSSDDLALNGYVLSCQKSGGGQSLTLTAGTAAQAKATAAPTAAATPVPAKAVDLPQCFIPQTAAVTFNNLLGPTLEAMGAPDPGKLAEQYKLTKADIVNNVLFLSSADGRVEINAFFEDGQPALDRQATTLGLAMAKDVDRSELFSLAATFVNAIAQLDDSVGNFEDLLYWISGSIDSGAAAIRPMNGYSMAYVKGENGYMFTLTPDAAGGGTPATQAPQATAEPVFTPVPTPVPTQALPDKLDGAFMEYNGLSVQLLKYEISSTGSVWLYFRVLNNSDVPMKLQVRSCSVNGVPVYGTSIGDVDAHSDSSAEDCMLTAYNDESRADGQAALADPRTIGLTVVVKDKDYHELTAQPITIDTATLSVKPGAAPTKAPRATATPKPASAPMGYYYQSLAKGDRGEDVMRLQQKLIQLGYLSDSADGQYGSKTAAAVRAFNEANGFGSSEVATIAMQEKLFSSSAKAWSEPWIPVEVPQTQWKNINVEGAAYRFKFKNTSKTKTIKGIEVCYYVTDVWGKRLWGSTISRSFTTNVTIKPGKTGWSMWFYMTPSWYTIADIHIGIKKIAFADGTVHENTSDSYDWTCTLH